MKERFILSRICDDVREKDPYHHLVQIELMESVFFINAIECNKARTSKN